jgi:hypothetical protein
MLCNTDGGGRVGRGGAGPSSLLFCTDRKDGTLRTAPVEVVVMVVDAGLRIDAEDTCEEALVCLLRGAVNVVGEASSLLADVDVVRIDASLVLFCTRLLVSAEVVCGPR